MVVELGSFLRTTPETVSRGARSRITRSVSESTFLPPFKTLSSAPCTSACMSQGPPKFLSLHKSSIVTAGTSLGMPSAWIPSLCFRVEGPARSGWTLISILPGSSLASAITYSASYGKSHRELLPTLSQLLREEGPHLGISHTIADVHRPHLRQ